VRFDEIRLGPRHQSAPRTTQPLPTTGCVGLPGGWRVTIGPCTSNEERPGPAVHASEREAEGLVLRTREPGDRIHFHGREVSLKRFLSQRRVPFDLRPDLPIIAAGQRVLWVSGQTADASDCGPRKLHMVIDQVRPESGRPDGRAPTVPRSA
jgi:tRNA(Ile)-lysidine synthetase-like protein